MEELHEEAKVIKDEQLAKQIQLLRQMTGLLRQMTGLLRQIANESVE